MQLCQIHFYQKIARKKVARVNATLNTFWAGKEVLFFVSFCSTELHCKIQRWSRGHKAQGQGHKQIRGQSQGQPFRGQTLSRPRTGMLEAKDQGHKHKCSPKKKVFTKIFQAISTKKRFPKKFSSAPQNFNNSKNTAVLEPKTGQFLRN